MTDFLDESPCPKCRGSVEVRREGNTQGLFCTQCDWSVVTTNIPDILRDAVSYEVRVTSGDFKNERHLKSVAQLAGVNLLEARKLLQGQASFVVYTGRAHEVTAARDVLWASGLAFDIQPPFPW
jgi:uncharacterized protein YbaR (Trm112 family)